MNTATLAAPLRRRSPETCFVGWPIAFALSLTITACDSDGVGAEALSVQTTPQRASQALAFPEPAGSHCINGGARIDAGIDRNGNGRLEPGEISTTQYVCNGAVGTTGAMGTAGPVGPSGTNGLSTLVRMDVEPAGRNCPAGGTKITAGVDVDGNGVLERSEISGSPDYVCNAVPGATGMTGTAGSAGTSGSNGLNSLIAMTPEVPGANCQYGGSKVSAGLDIDSNGVLAATEITSTSYACNSAPAAGISWVRVSATSQQTSAGMGYIADNAAVVTFTLPVNPNLGDVIGIDGLGSGGWRIAQNASQRIVTKALSVRSTATNYGATWTPQAAAGLNRSWYAVASSADGSKLVAAANNDQIYTSTDAGATWTARNSVQEWASVASSADGSMLLAAVSNGPLYTSTDSGVSWTPRNSSRLWFSVASSASGDMLVAAAAGDRLYTSTDAGVTWTARDSSRNWVSVASSADGYALAAAEIGGQIYTSTDAGVTWTPRETNRNWTSIASSADGIKLVALAAGDRIYTSPDGGARWIANESNRNWWLSVASSADGSHLVAVENGGLIYTSVDYGANWTARDNSRDWASVAMSHDGTRLVAVEIGGAIYTSVNDGTTTGISGSLSGGQYDAIELRYLGDGLFAPVSARTGSLDGFVVQ